MNRQSLNHPHRRLPWRMSAVGLAWLVVLGSLPAVASEAGDAAAETVPQDVDRLWADVDPCRDPLEVEVVREWEEEGGAYRYVAYTIGTFQGVKAWMAAFYGFPKHGSKLPAVMHMHGGGQRAMPPAETKADSE